MPTRSKPINRCDSLEHSLSFKNFKIMSAEEILESIQKRCTSELNLQKRSLALCKNESATSDVSAICSVDSDESDENIRNRMAYLQNWLKTSFSQQFPSNKSVSIELHSSSIDKTIKSIQNMGIDNASSSAIKNDKNHNFDVDSIFSKNLDSESVIYNLKSDSEVDFCMPSKNTRCIAIATDSISLDELKSLRTKLSARLGNQIDLVPDKDLLDIYSLLPENDFYSKLAGNYQTNNNFNSCSNFCGDGFRNTNFQVYPLLISQGEIEQQAVESQSGTLENIDQQLNTEFDNLERIYKNIYVNLDKVLHLNDVESDDKGVYSGSIDDIENDLQGVLDELKASLTTMEENFYKQKVLDTNKCTTEKIQNNVPNVSIEDEIRQTIDELLKDSYYFKETAISKGVAKEDMMVYVDHNESSFICSDILHSILDTALNTKSESNKSLSCGLPYRTFQSGDTSDSNRKKAVYFCTTSLNSKVPKTSFSFGEGVSRSRSITKSLQKRRVSNYSKCKNEEKSNLVNTSKVKHCDNFTKVKCASDHDNDGNTISEPYTQNSSVGMQKSPKTTKMDIPAEELPSTSFSVDPLATDKPVKPKAFVGAIPKTSFKAMNRATLSSSDEDETDYEHQLHIKRRKQMSTAYQTDEFFLKPARAYPNLQSSNEFLPRSTQMSDISLKNVQPTDTDYEGDHEDFQLHFFQPAYRYMSNHELNSQDEILEIEKNVLANLELQRDNNLLIGNSSSNESEYDYSPSCNLSLISPDSINSNSSTILQVIDINDEETSNTLDDIETPNL